MKQWFRIFLLGLTVVVLTACGRGGGNPDSQAQKKTISGYVVDDPIDGATVTLLSLGQEELNSTVTDSNGSYTLTVAEDKISDGYILEATGGKMNGVDFNETLRAIYKASDDVSHANITLITSLVAKMAMDDNSTNRSGNILSKRDDALKKLVDMGMVKASDWFTDAPSLVNMGKLYAIIFSKGTNSWIDDIVTDLRDNQLNKKNMLVFEHAHGGLVDVNVAPEKYISLFPGQIKRITLSPEFTSSNDRNITVRIISAPEWVSVENNNTLKISPPSNLETFQEFTVSVESTVDNVKIGRNTNITISLLKGVVLLSGDLGSSGGKIENQWKDISLSVDAGVLSEDHSIELIAAIDNNGALIKHFKITPEMTQQEKNKLKLIIPTNEMILNNYFNTVQRTQINRSSSSLLNSCLTESWGSYRGSGFKYPTTWLFSQGSFIDTGDWDFNGYPRAVNSGVNDTESKCAFVLRSRYPKYKFDPNSQLYDESLEGKEAVLFVHGFIRTGELGGYDKDDSEIYFGKFPALIEKLGYLPFEFDWRTNANFRQVADELAKSIELITEKTGKQVHIVAHSYGGVLVRTLVEGLAFNTNYNIEWAKKHIATITTVGTPHQGIFSERTTVNGILFPPGFTNTLYGNAAKLCKAITCYQMGNDWDQVSDNKLVYGVDSAGKHIARLNENMDNYPEIYTQVLIGLDIPNPRKSVECRLDMPNLDQCVMAYSFPKKNDEGDGDYLISLDSQRIVSFSQNGFNPLLNGTYIKEHLLGFRKTTWNNFEEGYEDWIMDKLNERIDDKSIDLVYSDYPVQINARSDKSTRGFASDFVLGYSHTTGKYEKYISFDYDKFFGYDGIPTGSYMHYAGRNSEVGIQDCDLSSSVDECKNATFNYVRYILQEHPASAINEPLKILIRGDVRYAGVINNNLTNSSIDRNMNRNATNVPPFPVTIEVYTGSFSDLFFGGDTTTLKDDGTYELNVTFVPDSNYTVIAYPSGDTLARIGAVVRASASKYLRTLGTLEESILQFPTITLTDSNYEEGNLTIKVVDGQTGMQLNEFDAQIINTTGVDVAEGNTNGISSGYSLALPKGDYIIKIHKEGYNNNDNTKCTVLPLQNVECRVQLVSDATIANGQITAVLSWGATPSDLDSHLIRKTNGSQDYHVYYGNKNGIDANLDRDDTSSYGPETITINNVSNDSVYTYYIYNYSGGAGSVLPNSGAKVELNFNGTQRVFTVPNEEGRYWKVFEIDHGRIIPCVSGCVKNDTSTLIRSIDRDDSIFRNLPAK